MGAKILDLRVYIERMSIPVTETGCWLWLGWCNAQGYGKTGLHQQLAHRLSFEVFRGPIKGGALVLHTCDVPSCINPQHLYLGDHQDNSDDKLRRRPHLAGGPKLDICKRGHKRSAENLYEDGSCIACRKIVDRRRWLAGEAHGA